MARRFRTIWAKGGQVTNSPPSKVKLSQDEPCRVLASGFDTLYLSLDAEWGGGSFFEYLDELKGRAEDGKPTPGENHVADDTVDPWLFTVRRFGVNGYAYILDSRQFTAEIAATPKPGTRPNIRLLFPSETLWRLGARPSIDWALRHLAAANAHPVAIKPSRVDPCVDILIRESDWHEGLRPLLVTRAQGVSVHTSNGRLSGFSIGRSPLAARLYDKPLEIQQKSRKFWMYDIWGIDHVPEGYVVIRIEFEILREKLHRMGINLIDDLWVKQGELWAYCTEWLKLRDNPGKHHTQRHTLPWWDVVQTGFAGSQGAEPLVLDKASRAAREQVGRQVFGLMSSLTALRNQRGVPDELGMFSIVDEFPQLMNLAHELGISDESYTDAVIQKLGKQRRSGFSAGADADDAVSSDVPI